MHYKISCDQDYIIIYSCVIIRHSLSLHYKQCNYRNSSTCVRCWDTSSTVRTSRQYTGWLASVQECCAWRYDHLHAPTERYMIISVFILHVHEAFWSSSFDYCLEQYTYSARYKILSRRTLLRTYLFVTGKAYYLTKPQNSTAVTFM